ncbi:MAG: hypothetical protein N3C61_01220 [Candidatus Micrarchaeota archaeon]|nr:hypothetical protein [Candidatus Micrarchaeota archaeon]
MKKYIFLLGVLLLLAGCIGSDNNRNYTDGQKNLTDRNITEESFTYNHSTGKKDTETINRNNRSTGRENIEITDRDSNIYQNTTMNSTSQIQMEMPRSGDNRIGIFSENVFCNITFEVSMEDGVPVEYTYLLYKYGKYYRIDVEQRIDNELLTVTSKYGPADTEETYIVSTKISVGNHSECQVFKTRVNSNQQIDQNFQQQIDLVLNYRTKHAECKELSTFDRIMFRRDC